jgi:hypothetical protein
MFGKKQLTDEVKQGGDLFYGLIENLISEEGCLEMFNRIETLFRRGSGKKDGQCPLSASFHNSFCDVQNQLTEVVSSFFDKNLIPTYNYCRRYEMEDELKIHVDRVECEYSLTLNVGNSGKVWPFFACLKRSAPSKIIIEPGDAVIYKGIEVLHWRERNIYSETSQVFFHWVDSQGPYNTRAYDCAHGRSKREFDRAAKNFNSINLY